MALENCHSQGSRRPLLACTINSANLTYFKNTHRFFGRKIIKRATQIQNDVTSAFTAIAIASAMLFGAPMNADPVDVTACQPSFELKLSIEMLFS